MFADATGLEVVLTDSAEAGALGTAMCAMVGAGLHDSVEAAIRAAVHDTDRLIPDDGAERDHLETGYEHHRRVIDARGGRGSPRAADGFRLTATPRWSGMDHCAPPVPRVPVPRRRPR
jgi:ribulose kinase